jgi:potassium-transporting ATPase KdpC subunit
MRRPNRLTVPFAALRMVLVFTVLLGLCYPLGMTLLAQLPGLRDQANGSMLDGPNGRPVGSALIGQSFTDAKGNPLRQYFQPRPSNAGAGYDPTASGASNLGPASVLDTLADPHDPHATATLSLLSRVCQASLAVGQLEGVDGRRPYCTADGVGAILGVFHANGLTGPVTEVVSVDQECPTRPFVASYLGVPVRCAQYGADYSHAVLTPIRGDAPETPVVPSDAVTASASGLDPDISPAYARLQAARVARARGISTATALGLIPQYTTGPALGVLGAPSVNVLQLNLALDRSYPKRGA